ncbi:MAG TPA: zinc ribbon domain-containing protein [Lacipirellulaceae bacterium]|nr:zinc ribbon domain-containing protein [Lacipirellulaceae bacterium]
MPLFDYCCSACGREQELLVRDGETPVCESCGEARLEKLLSLPIAHSAGGAPSPRRGEGAGPCGPRCGCH